MWELNSSYSRDNQILTATDLTRLNQILSTVLYSCLKRSSTDWLSFLEWEGRDLVDTGKRVFLLSQNIWLQWCVTISQFCRNANWRCWRNTPDLMHLDNSAVLMQIWWYGAQNRGYKNCRSQILIFTKQFLRLRWSGAHGTSQACH